VYNYTFAKGVFSNTFFPTQEGHPVCKNCHMGVGLLVVIIWLELCTTYSSNCHHFHNPLLKQAVGGRPPQYTSPLRSWPFDLETGVWVKCDVCYLCANFSLPRSLCSWLRPDVRDRRQTGGRQTASSLNAPPIRGGA